MAGQGLAGLGVAWLGWARHGMARLGAARQGKAWLGSARQGKAFKNNNKVKPNNGVDTNMPKKDPTIGALLTKAKTIALRLQRDKEERDKRCQELVATIDRLNQELLKCRGGHASTSLTVSLPSSPATSPEPSPDTY